LLAFDSSCVLIRHDDDLGIYTYTCDAQTLKQIKDGIAGFKFEILKAI